MERPIFEEFRRIIYEKAGISLGEKKEALVSARVAKRLRALKMPSHVAYLRYLKADESEEELIHLLDVISTNVTSFFREPAHFDFLADAMAGWLAKGRRRFRFWSAACSTGEEPYTLAVVLRQISEGYHGLDTRILATDISMRALKKAKAGIYPDEKTAGIPLNYRNRFFDMQGKNGSKTYAVKEELKRMTLFKRFNLAAPPFPMKGPMDAVFCRNVMIYFDNEVRRRLLAEIERLLKPGGLLFVGHAESLAGQLCNLKSVQPSVYRKQ